MSSRPQTDLNLKSRPLPIGLEPCTSSSVPPPSGLINKLSHEIRHSNAEIDPAVFNELFTLDTDETLQVLETPLVERDRHSVFFGQPGTMSNKQLLQYLKWIFSKACDEQTTPHQKARLLNLLHLASVPKLTTLTSYIRTLNQEEFTKIYLDLISFFASHLPPKKIINFIRLELASEELDSFFQDEHAVHFFAMLLTRLTQCPQPTEISNLILTDILQPDDLFIKMLKSPSLNVINLLHALEKTANSDCFDKFLQQSTQEGKSYMKEIEDFRKKMLQLTLIKITTESEVHQTEQQNLKQITSALTPDAKVTAYSDCELALETMMKALDEKEEEIESIVLGFRYLQGRMASYIESLASKEKAKILDAFFKENSPLGLFFSGASHLVRCKIQSLRGVQQQQENPRQPKFFSVAVCADSTRCVDGRVSMR